MKFAMGVITFAWKLSLRSQGLDLQKPLRLCIILGTEENP